MADFFALLTALATLGLALIAWRQLSELRLQQQGRESLKICQAYDLDPVRNDALKTVRAGLDSGEAAANSGAFEYEIALALNLLEGVATGIEQGFFNQGVVKQHRQPVLRGHIKELMESGITAALGFDERDYVRRVNLDCRWTSTPAPWYTMS